VAGEGRRHPPAAGQCEEFRREPVAPVGHEQVGPNAGEGAFEEIEEFALLRLVGLAVGAERLAVDRNGDASDLDPMPPGAAGMPPNGLDPMPVRPLSQDRGEIGLRHRIDYGTAENLDPESQPGETRNQCAVGDGGAVGVIEVEESGAEQDAANRRSP